MKKGRPKICTALLRKVIVTCTEYIEKIQRISVQLSIIWVAKYTYRARGASQKRNEIQALFKR